MYGRKLDLEMAEMEKIHQGTQPNRVYMYILYCTENIICLILTGLDLEVLEWSRKLDFNVRRVLPALDAQDEGPMERWLHEVGVAVVVRVVQLHLFDRQLLLGKLGGIFGGGAATFEYRRKDLVFNQLEIIDIVSSSNETEMVR